MSWAKHIKHHPEADAPAKIKEVAEEMSEAQLSHYTSTPSEGLPEKKKEAASKIPQEEIQEGLQEEMEHTQNKRLRRKITMDHLKEEPHYYSKIRKCLDKKASVADYAELAYYHGFVKAAQDAGFTIKEANQIFNQAIG